MKTIAVDLTWVRHNKVGGTESYIRNLLKGFGEVNPDKIKFLLLLARDNAEFFNMYDAECFEQYICDVKSESQKNRVLWQNRELGRLLINLGINMLFEPIYGIPFWGMKEIKVIATIHDLQAIHYPEYFNAARCMWMKVNWRNTIKHSSKVVAISDYVHNDIVKELRADSSKIVTIYNAIDFDENNMAGEEYLKQYGIERDKFYYTVSSLLPHKNLETLIRMLAELKRNESKQLYPLVVSGVGGSSKESLIRLAKENNVAEYVIITPFVEDKIRNMLYKNCRAFLFPSLFEGFGMPPVEAAAYGALVLATRCTSIKEVTRGLINYIDDPLDYTEWAMSLCTMKKVKDKDRLELIRSYSPDFIAQKYIDMFLEM